MMKKVLTMALAALTLTACNTKKAETPVEEETTAPKTLVLYYSQTGTTEKVAKLFQQKLNADIETIELAEPFEGDYNETIAYFSKLNQEGKTVDVKPLNANLEDYDVIVLGYPIWFGNCAAPIQGLLKSVDFSGKKVVAFATFGSGGIVESAAALKEAGLDIIACYGVRSALIDTAEEGVTRVLVENGLIEGEVEALADYTEQQPATDEEKAIFAEAIADYAMLNGAEAVLCGGRTTSTGTDFLFKAEMTAKDGAKTQMQVHVTKPNAEGAKAFFTQVDR